MKHLTIFLFVFSFLLFLFGYWGSFTQPGIMHYSESMTPFFAFLGATISFIIALGIRIFLWLNNINR